MSGPTISNVHINRPLTNLAVGYIQDEKAFIAGAMSPMVPVLKKSDKFFVMPKDAWFRAGAQFRAPGTETAGLNYALTTQDYVCDTIGAHFDLDDQTRANYDTPLNAQTTAMKFVNRNMLLTRELLWMQKFFQPNIWTGYVPTPGGTPTDYNVATMGTGLWTTQTSDPVLDVQRMCTIVESRTGYRPNKMAITQDVLDVLLQNKAVLDRIRYVQKAVATPDLLASMFQMDELHIAKAVINTAQDGRVANMGFIASNSLLLTYSPNAPAIGEPSASYIFNWTGFLGAGAFGNVMKTFRMEWLQSDRIEGQMSFDMRVVASDLGVFATNIVA